MKCGSALKAVKLCENVGKLLSGVKVFTDTMRVGYLWNNLKEKTIKEVNGLS